MKTSYEVDIKTPIPRTWKAVVFYGLVSIGMALRDGLADVASAQHLVRSDAGEIEQNKVTLYAAVERFLGAWWEFDGLDRQAHFNAIAETVEALNDAFERAAPMGDDLRETPS